jgi:cytochrome c-type biogenesis protein CcmH/NrfG
LLDAQAALSMTFSRRDLFWYSAGVLSVLVVALLVHALDGAAPALATASLPESAPAPIVEASPSAQPANTGGGPKAAGAMDEVLGRLEARLASQGGSDADWELLAQTYDFVGRGADAKLARAHQLPAASHPALASPRCPVLSSCPQRSNPKCQTV